MSDQVCIHGVYIKLPCEVCEALARSEEHKKKKMAEWALLPTVQAALEECAPDYSECSFECYGPLVSSAIDLERRCRELEDFIRDGLDLVNRGVDLMTKEQLGQWRGVRTWIESTPERRKE